MDLFTFRTFYDGMKDQLDEEKKILDNDEIFLLHYLSTVILVKQSKNKELFISLREIINDYLQELGENTTKDGKK